MKKIIFCLFVLSPLFCNSQNQWKTAEISSNFTRYEFKNYSLSIPNTMELRGENSDMALVKAMLVDQIKRTKKIDIVDANFVFQPAGTDDVQNPEKQKKALDLYARILISYHKGASDEYLRWNDDITYSQSTYNQLNKMLKDDILYEAKQMGTEIVSIDNVKIKKNTNKFVYFELQYIRKGLNGNVKVIDYYLHNNNEGAKLTISYRISDNNLWELDFSKIIDTFSFNIKK